MPSFTNPESMNLYFNIDYQTVFGEELVLNIVTNNGQGRMPNNAISHAYHRRIALELLYKQVARRLPKRSGVLLLRG